jgi:hypothetical protein
MIKATAIGPNDEKILYIGLSFGNLDKFRAQPLDTVIKIEGKEVGCDHDILIFSGATEEQMMDMMTSGIGPQTKLHIDPRLKS